MVPLDVLDLDVVVLASSQSLPLTLSLESVGIPPVLSPTRGVVDPKKLLGIFGGVWLVLEQKLTVIVARNIESVPS